MVKPIYRHLIFLFVFGLLLPTLVSAGTTGKIAGVVTDANTGDPLPGVNIIIVGTTLGAMTDLDGDYFIINVPVGQHTVRAQMLGFQTQEKQNLQVSVDVTTEVNFRLKETVIEIGKEIVVVGDRPLIQKDVTTKTTTLNAQQIENMPVTNVQQILETQAGVVAVQGYQNKVAGFEARGIDQIHVRGGRNAEVAYMIDGMYVEDPIYGGRGTNINREAINEMVVITGNFNAEYGEAMSQVVNIVTKEGGTDYTGMVEHSSGEVAGWLGSERDDIRNSHDDLSSFGGPVPFISGMNFFLSSEHAYKKYVVYEFDDITYDPTYVHQLSPDDPRYIELQDQIDEGIISNPRWETVADMAADTNHALWGGAYRVGDELRTYSYGHWRRAWRAPDPNNSNKLYDWDKWSGWHGYGYDQNYDFSGKLTYRLDQSMKLTLTDRFTRREFRSYDRAWQYAEQGKNVGVIKTNQQGINWTHTLTPSTFYNIVLSGFWIERTMRAHGVDSHELNIDDESGGRLGYYDYEVSDGGDTSVVFIPVNEYGAWDLYDGFYRDQEFTRLDSIGVRPEINDGDSLLVFHRYKGSSDRYLTRNGGQRWNFDLDLTSQVNKYHQIKTGLEYTRYNPVYFSELQILYRTPEPYREEYSIKPQEGAFYIQDKMEYPNLVINAGFRVDYANSKGRAFRNFDDPTSGINTGKKKWQVSPRLGVGYPITDKSTFHFAYGHFFQNPEYRNIYLNQALDVVTQNLLGNANLEAQKTVSLEVGVRQQLGDVWAVDVTLWSKEITGLAGTINVVGFDVDSLGPYNYYTFANYDHGTSRGIDLSIEKRFSNYYSGTLNYTYSVAKANRYYSWTGYWDSQTEEDEPKKDILMDYDRTHMLDINSDIRFPKDFGPSVGGVKPLENLYFNILMQLQSGQPYTPYVGSREGDPNSERIPMYFTIDLVARKEFETVGIRYGVFARIFNLLDRQNPIGVYEETGSPTDPDPTQDTTRPSTYFDRPFHFGPRRSIDLGFRLYF
ncbi:MAG: TonB-dependent receptor [Gemmatimonadota bacterium]|nr:MAG: TonB-dependent receptor [Gemmatimonadota bacterium]